MVLIFTDTTSVLSTELVSLFSAEKLALALFRISKDSDVEFSQVQKSFTISGDWLKVSQAFSSLEEYVLKEQQSRQEEHDQERETPYLSQNHFSSVAVEGRRGRKPGSTVSNASYDAVPEPYVQYHNDQGLPVAVTSHKRSRDFDEVENNDVKSEVDRKERNALKKANSEQLKENVEKQAPDKALDVLKPENDTSISKNDCDYITVKEEFDENAMDDDTDIDEQYLDKTDLQNSEPTHSNELETEVEIKVENISSDDGRKDSSKSRRKSRPKKHVLKVPLSEEEKEVTNKTKTAPKAKRGKGRPKLQENKTDESKKTRKKKKKVAKIEDKETEFKCEKCEYVGKKKENLREHMQRMHRNKFKCETCKKHFGLHKDLLRHTRHVHTNPAYHCKVCDKFYKFSRAYKEHMLSHEENYVKPQFECEVCHKVFSTKYVLTGHVKSEHLGMKKSFMCPTCGRSFTQKNSYLMHANVHAGIKPYVCDVCGKAFSYDKSLKEHKYMHDDERRFTCDVCAKTFRQKTSLLMHMKVHKEARDYICTSCGKGFTQKQALLRHERIHSGDKPFKCALCSRSFNDYSIIRRHMMMHHKRDKDPKTWRGDIICSLKRKTEFYIEGGPGYNGGDRLPTAEPSEDATLKAVIDNTVDTHDKSLENTENGEFISHEDNLTQPSNNSAVASQQNNEINVPKHPEIQTSLPDCSEMDRTYHSQGMSETTEAVSKIQEPDITASPSLPINYSLPASYQSNVQSIPVTSVQNADNDDIHRQYHEMVDSYRLQGQRRDLFMQNLSSMAPLPGLPQAHQLPPVSGETTQGQPLPNPWGIPNYTPYYSPANFSHYQGPQS